MCTQKATRKQKGYRSVGGMGWGHQGGAGGKVARWDREAGQQAQGGAARRGPREQEPQGASRKVAPPTRTLKAAGTPTRAKPLPRTARPPGGLGRWMGEGELEAKPNAMDGRLTRQHTRAVTVCLDVLPTSLPPPPLYTLASPLASLADRHHRRDGGFSSVWHACGHRPCTLAHARQAAAARSPLPAETRYFVPLKNDRCFRNCYSLTVWMDPAPEARRTTTD